jgi:ATP-dependent helicase/nuclease subunit A
MTAVRDEPLERFDAKRLRQARALFAKALETPGGIKIQTIHAFAERLLRQFPLEAGAPPGFKVVDDSIGAVLRSESVRALHEAEDLTVPLRAVAGTRVRIRLPAPVVDGIGEAGRHRAFR